MTTPTKLALYNQALRMVGEGKLSALTDNRPERHALDSIWDEDPIKQTLEEAQWTFAIRSLEWNYDPAIEPDFGYKYAFTKPSNYVRSAAICSDEFYSEPIVSFADENNYWFCEYETIYIKYVSDHDQFGRDYSLWSELFRNCVATKMAAELAISLTKSQGMTEALEKKHKKYIKEAKSLDAMNQPTRFMPPGNWTRSRRSSSRNFRGTYSNR
jgi:hypothetical protein